MAGIDSTNSRPSFCADAADSLEIMCTDKGSGCTGNQIHIQLLRPETDTVSQERIANTAVKNFIDILFFQAGRNRIKVRLCITGRDNRNIIRKARIDGKRNSVNGYRCLRPEIGTIAQGVNPGIRPSAAGYFCPDSQHFFQCILHCLGNGTVLLLNLPTMIPAAVVSQAKCNISHLLITPALSGRSYPRGRERQAEVQHDR